MFCGTGILRFEDGSHPPKPLGGALMGVTTPQNHQFSIFSHQNSYSRLEIELKVVVGEIFWSPFPPVTYFGAFMGVGIPKISFFTFSLRNSHFELEICMKIIDCKISLSLA